MPASTDEKPTPAQLQADEEMAAIKNLTQQVSVEYGVSESLTLEQKAEIAKRSLRAWNLDPSCEPAAYYACLFHLALYPKAQTNSSEYIKDAYLSNIKLGEKYFALFGEKVDPLHYYHLSIMLTNMRHISPKKKMIYLAQTGFWELRNMQKCHTNFHIVVWGHLLAYITLIPDNELNDELEYWRKIYESEFLPSYKIFLEKHYTSYGEFSSCWEIVEATFYARLKNWKQTRTCLQQAANKYPQSNVYRWNIEKPCDISDRIQKLLRIAGDPEWKTWMPVFTSRPAAELQKESLFSLLLSYSTRFNGAFEMHPKLFLPSPLMLPFKVVKLPDVQSVSTQIGLKDVNLKCVQPCGVINDKWMLFVTPILHDVINQRYDSTLCIGERVHMYDVEEPVCKNLSEAPWPTYPVPSLRKKIDDGQNVHTYRVISYYIQNGDSQDDWTLWVGTMHHGLAKITHNRKNEWGGRWYTMQDGLPEKSTIANILPGVYKGMTGMLVFVQYDYRINSRNTSAVFFIALSDDKIYLIKDKISDSCQIAFPGRNGFIVPLSGGWGNDGVCMSSIRSIDGWADFCKEDVEYLNTHDIANATISGTNLAYLSGWLGIRRNGRKDKISFSRNDAELYKEDGSRKILCKSPIHRLYDGATRLGAEGILFQEPRPFLMGRIEAMALCGEKVCLVINYRNDFQRHDDMIFMFFWEAGNGDNPFVNDKWYGPFVWNGDKDIAAVVPDADGFIWMVVHKSISPGICRINADEAIKIAETNNKVYSSSELFDMYYNAIGPGKWQQQLKLLYANGEKKKVLERLDEIIKKNSSEKNQNYCDAIMFKAAIYASNKDTYNDSIQCYQKLLAEDLGPEYQYLAKRNIGTLNYQMGDYQKAIDMLCALPNDLDVSQSSQQTLGAADCTILNQAVQKYWLGYYLKQAKVKLATQQKDKGGQN